MYQLIQTLHQFIHVLLGYSTYDKLLFVSSSIVALRDTLAEAYSASRSSKFKIKSSVVFDWLSASAYVNISLSGALGVDNHTDRILDDSTVLLLKTTSLHRLVLVFDVFLL